ncbi:peptide/nickel transport system substrate-binding protein [Comamonas sp. BIGb0124]|uniref:ABC transporter substrate-binding protein n=1 Tax=Comamonas sp. BIGb0124 TaxID=2485130 RepID=UPI000FA39974|nr:ABC transporter substrate-binding protein [Comamonas sp. BIGb0124]ROR18545.1 peptide/nickel transport system substrate-binding protein [Comamonas sp. BIGb0124]
MNLLTTPPSTRPLRMALALLAVGFSLAAAAPAMAQAQPVSGGSLTWGVETEPATLNPHFNGQDKVVLLLRNAYESLLARTPDGGFLPWLATGYTLSADGKTLAFTLRQDVKFSDGSALDAAAVVRNFKAIQDPAYTSSSGSLAAHGARLADVKALDAYTVQLTLKQAYAPFLAFAGSFALLSPASFDKPNIKSGGVGIAGTGPFVLQNYQKGQQLEFARNAAYNWAPSNAGHQGPAYLERVTYRFLPESSVRTGALLSGQVDLIEGISGNDARLFKDSPEYSYHRALNTGTPYSLFLNVDYGPTQDVRVRRALLEGLDVSPILQSIYRGERTRTWGITSPIDPFYDKRIENTYGNNPQLANQLLDEAGWTQRDAQGYRTKDGQRLTIELIQAQATVRDQRDVLLQAVQAQARQKLGIDFKLNYVDAGTYTELRKTGRFGSIANSNTPPDGIDIEYHYLPIDQGGSINYSRSADPKLSVWLKAAAATSVTAERKRLYGELQHYAIKELALAVPLYEPEDQIAAARHVQGVRFRVFHQLPENPYDIWIKK